MQWTAAHKQHGAALQIGVQGTRPKFDHARTLVLADDSIHSFGLTWLAAQFSGTVYLWQWVLEGACCLQAHIAPGLNGISSTSARVT